MTVNGVRLACDDVGSGAPAFVFIHGWCCDRSFFAPQVEHFGSSHHRVVSIDLRGHGGSDQPSGPYTIGTFADDIAGLIDILGLGKVIAVGHSLGGNVALQLAVAHPDRVAGVVMVDPGPLEVSPPLRAFFDEMIEAIESGDREPQRRMVERMFLPASDQTLVDRVVQTMTSAPAHVAVAELRALLEFGGVATAAACSVPALHIAQTSPSNPPHLMSQWLPHVVHGWAVGGGHFSHLESPAEMNAMIEGFLRFHLGPTES